MTNESQSPSRARLCPALDKQLISYATAAGAAGVALLAVAQPAEAKIIYTAANIPIVANAGPVLLDVNNDGVADFSFYAASGSGLPRAGQLRRVPPPLGGFFAYFGVGPAPGQTGNEVGAITSFVNAAQCAAEVPGNIKVGNGDNFQSGFLEMFGVAGNYTNPGTAVCPWKGNNNKGGFLALKFVVSGQTYYGWAHISRTGTSPTITGYAYESVAGGSIKTGDTHGPSEQSGTLPGPALTEPQPATLGALALGASGMQIWRKPEDGQV